MPADATPSGATALLAGIFGRWGSGATKIEFCGDSAFKGLARPSELSGLSPKLFLERAIEGAESTLAAVLRKARLWARIEDQPLNDRQRKVINRLLDGFEGKLTSSKWAALTKSSPDTALRDINDLIVRGILDRHSAGGRSTSYLLVEPPPQR